jgi:hypothetical protein
VDLPVLSQQALRGTQQQQQHRSADNTIVHVQHLLGVVSAQVLRTT